VSLLQVTLGSAASEGETVATRLRVPSTARLKAVSESDTPVTVVTLDSLTVTAQIAVLPWSAVVTVMVAVPAFTPVTRPASETVATLVALLLHVTAAFVASDGATVALRVALAPTASLSAAVESVTPATVTEEVPPGEAGEEQARNRARAVIEAARILVGACICKTSGKCSYSSWPESRSDDETDSAWGARRSQDER
jgi:hypothetical protein